MTPASIRTGAFVRLMAVPLDEQVDGQPLYVAGQAIVGMSIRNVVYVATENNPVYAVDAIPDSC